MMIRKTILTLSICALIFSCSDKDSDPEPLPTKSGDKYISSFSFNDFSPVVKGTKSDSTSINLLVPNGTEVKALVPTISVSPKAAISPASGVAVDFTKSVDYTVTAEDGTSRIYKVTVTVNPNVSFTAIPGSLDLMQGGEIVFTGNGLGTVQKDKIELVDQITKVSNTLSITSASDTKIKAVIPSNQNTGVYSIRITIGTESKVLDAVFNVAFHPPVLAGLSDDHYEQGTGTKIVLSGGYFGETNNTVILSYDDQEYELDVTEQSTTQITVSVSDDLFTGDYDIYVKAHGLKSETKTFSIIPPSPAITSVNKTTLSASDVLVVTGRNLKGMYTNIEFMPANGGSGLTFIRGGSTTADGKTFAYTIPADLPAGKYNISLDVYTDDDILFSDIFPTVITIVTK